MLFESDLLILFFEHFIELFAQVGDYSQIGVRDLVCPFLYTKAIHVDKFIVYWKTTLLTIYSFLIRTLGLLFIQFLSWNIFFSLY